MANKRAPNRTTTEKIEDAFADLSLIEQAQMLERLRSLHRWCTRERDRRPEPPADKPQTGDQAEAAGRKEYERVTTNGRTNAELPQEHEA